MRTSQVWHRAQLRLQNFPKFLLNMRDKALATQAEAEQDAARLLAAAELPLRTAGQTAAMQLHGVVGSLPAPTADLLSISELPRLYALASSLDVSP